MEFNNWLKDGLDHEFSAQRKDVIKSRRNDGSPTAVPSGLIGCLSLETRDSINAHSYVCVYYRINSRLFIDALRASLEHNKQMGSVLGYTQESISQECPCSMMVHSINEDNNGIETAFIVVFADPSGDSMVLVTAENDLKWTAFIKKIREYLHKTTDRASMVQGKVEKT